ncbi:glycoside hydrolase 43 family protein [Microbulbifer sp. SH-1]|uniref:glycoside hydrolase family 43 protein n=1 Tax=Microbulbifer sp. SH-1 TaxID=2681547 RepID=UPI001F0E863D|nr:glycoside hydrolase 43 family protein [Microbulbifer sp. SH-1]
MKMKQDVQAAVYRRSLLCVPVIAALSLGLPGCGAESAGLRASAGSDTFNRASGVNSAAGVPEAVATRNPIVWADVPDVSVIRVGDNYYMSSTTMHMNPGLPILKSRDLVNWTLLGYAYDTLVDNAQMNLEDGKNAYGKGSWASSLRYHDGRFYVSTFSATSGKTHVYRTDDIERGNWHETAFEPDLHDHSLFFDDGRVFMVYGSNEIRLVELEEDFSGIKADGINQVIIADAGKVAGEDILLPAEGSQLHKIDGRYYLMNITWPRNGMRTVVIHRADQLTGPYEGRVALQYQGIAQGGLIDTPEGDWYALLFGDRGAVGRIPYLVPVTWKEGWPILGREGAVPTTLNVPVNGKPVANTNVAGMVTSDEFDQPRLPLPWQWNHNPDNDHWSLSARPGYLRLTNGRVDTDLLQARNTLTQRTFGPESTAEVRLDLSAMHDGDVAGLTLLQKHYGYVGVVREAGERFIVMMSAEGESPRELDRVRLQGDVVYLKAHADFRDLKDTAHFSYSTDGEAWLAIGAPLAMTYTLPHFMGYRFGLFSFATAEPGGHVDFDYFRLDKPAPYMRGPTLPL